MKTLKKTLCLVLAVVMAVGVLILPANAADYDDFTDADEINKDYEVAVATLTGMGIINGKSATIFDPTSPVTRAEAATLVARALVAPEKLAMAVLGCTSPFTDIEGNYAKNYINYDYEQGVINGKSDTVFASNDLVTGYELATMLMNATGYEPSDETVSWTAKAAEFCGVYNIFGSGLEEVFANMNKPLTREETAQMLWMAITHTDDDSKTYDVYRINGDTVDANGNPVDIELCEKDVTLERLVYWRAALGEKLWFTINELGGTIAAKVHNLGKSTDPDIYGRPTITYYNTLTDDVYSSTPVQAIKTYENEAVTLKTIFADDLKVVTKANKSETIDVYQDGRLHEDIVVTSNSKEEADTYGGNGSQVLVYNDDGNYILVEINTYAVQLNDDMYVKATKKVAAHWNVILPDLVNTFLDDCDVLDYYVDDIESASIPQNGYKAGDVILFHIGRTTDKNEPTVQEYEKITPVESNITRKSNKRDNVQYIRLATEGEDNIYFTKFYNDTNDMTFEALKQSVSASVIYQVYFDDYGNVVYITSEAAEKIYGDYVYVLEYQAKYTTNTSGEDLYDEWNNASDSWPTSAKARILDLATGKVSVVWIDTAVVKNVTRYVDFYGNAKDEVQFVPYIGVDVTTDTKAPTGWKVPDGSDATTYAEYIEECKANYLGYHKVLRNVGEASDGSEIVSLRDLDHDDDLYTVPSVFSIDGADVRVKAGTDPWRVATNGTVLHVITKDTSKRNTYSITTKTGYKNFDYESLVKDGRTVDNVLVVYTNSNEYVIADIYLFGSYSKATPKTVQDYYIYTGRDDVILEDGTTRVWQYSFYLNGEEVDLLSKTQIELLQNSNPEDVFILSFDGKYIDEAELADPVVNADAAIKDYAGNNVFEVREFEDGQFIAVGEDNVVYLLNENYSVYDATEDGDGIDGVVEVGDYVQLYPTDPEKAGTGCECNLVVIIEKDYEN